jgi:hypothetical protein
VLAHRISASTEVEAAAGTLSSAAAAWLAGAAPEPPPHAARASAASATASAFPAHMQVVFMFVSFVGVGYIEPGNGLFR